MCCYSPDMLYRTFRGFGRKYPKWAVAGFTPNSKWTKNNSAGTELPGENQETEGLPGAHEARGRAGEILPEGVGVWKKK